MPVNIYYLTITIIIVNNNHDNNHNNYHDNNHDHISNRE